METIQPRRTFSLIFKLYGNCPDKKHLHICGFSHFTVNSVVVNIAKYVCKFLMTYVFE